MVAGLSAVEVCLYEEVLTSGPAPDDASRFQMDRIAFLQSENAEQRRMIDAVLRSACAASYEIERLRKENHELRLRVQRVETLPTPQENPLVRAIRQSSR